MHKPIGMKYDITALDSTKIMLLEEDIVKNSI